MRKKKGGFVRGLAVTLVVFALLLAISLKLLNYIGTASEAAQIETVKNAVRNAVVTCYAVEGVYPGDIDYLVKNYGLAYDESRFLVSYEAFASNIIPEIRVSIKGATGIE